jgi:CorA-like Mg2+ transporter protein
MESGGKEATSALRRSPTHPQRLVEATLWLEGRGPEKCDLDSTLPSRGVRWFDISPSATAEELIELLGSSCQGLELEMLEDLLCRDEVPEGRRWHGGAVRLASSFAVFAPASREGGGLQPVFTPSAEAVYEAVELLAGEDWLITRWHDACLFRGAKLLVDGLPPVSRDLLLTAVTKRWIARDGGNAGDLGVLAMHELALTYAPTHRRFRAALEEWELGLHEAVDGEHEVREEDAQRLRDLWGARARLRDWLNPLNVPGLRLDPEKAWLPASDHEEVVAVDERIDKALGALARLGDTLRSSFQLLHIKKSEAQRKRDEKLQWRVQVLATVFIVPTLIVGFYGANTWVPGEHRHWGFIAMVVAIVIFTSLVMALLWAEHRRHRAEHSVREAEQPQP